MQYRIKNVSRANDSKVYEGEIVYACCKPTYGVVGDDERMTGLEHRAVTRDPKGGYPFFTVPVADLERV